MSTTPSKRDAGHVNTQQQQETPNKRRKVDDATSAAAAAAAEQEPLAPPMLRVRKFENHAFNKYRQACFWKEMENLNQDYLPALRSLDQNRHISPHQFQVLLGYYLSRRQEILEKYSTDPGFVVVCGSNDNEQLGVRRGVDAEGEEISEVPPELIRFFDDKGIVQVASSSFANVAVSVDGSVYSWGGGEDGEVGRDNPVVLDGGISIPDKVTGFVSNNGTKEDDAIVMAAAGEACLYYLSAYGNVYMNGSVRDADFNKFGSTAQVLGPVKTPRHIVTEQPVIRVFSSCSSNIAVLLLRDGSLRTFGFGNMGELARSHDMREPTTVQEPNGKTTKTYDLGMAFYMKEAGDALKPNVELVRDKFLTPRPPRWQGPIPYPKKVVVSVAVGSFHLLVVARDPGHPHTFMYASGINRNGQLGLGDFEPRHELCKATDPRLVDLQQVAAGSLHSFALCMSGKYLYGFGNNQDGRLGIGYQPMKQEIFNPNPVLITFNSQDPVIITSISCGSDHALAISQDGDVYSWGYNDSGQTSIPHNTSIEAQTVYRPKKVDYSIAFGRLDTSSLQALQVCGGSEHSIFLVGPRKDPPTEDNNDED